MNRMDFPTRQLLGFIASPSFANSSPAMKFSQFKGLVSYCQLVSKFVKFSVDPVLHSWPIFMGKGFDDETTINHTISPRVLRSCVGLTVPILGFRFWQCWQIWSKRRFQFQRIYRIIYNPGASYF